MQHAELAPLIARWNRQQTHYQEIIRSADLSVGVYLLPAGGTDPQNPHTEDEVYQVLQGKAVLQVEQQNLPVGPGSVVFVAAHQAHRFHTIEQELVVLVFFAPAEYSRRPA